MLEVGEKLAQIRRAGTGSTPRIHHGAIGLADACVAGHLTYYAMTDNTARCHAFSYCLRRILF